MSSPEFEEPLLPAPIYATPEPPPNPIFTGPLGLRAGWGLLLFSVVFFALLVGLSFGVDLASPTIRAQKKQAALAKQLAQTEHKPPAPQMLGLRFTAVQEGSAMAAIVVAAWGISLVERRRFGVYGLRWRQVRDLLPGAFWGLAAMSVLVGALRALHLLVFDGRLLHGTATIGYGAAWLGVFLLVGLYEEFLFRGYLQFTLMRGLLGLARRVAPAQPRLVAFWIGAVLWSALFLASHLSNAGETPSGLLGVFFAGILFSYALWRTGSLWWGIGFHMTWDWAQSFLYGTPDSGTLSLGRLQATHAVGRTLLSGGVDGPEGSVLLLPVLLLVFAVLRMHKPAEQPIVEPRAELLSPNRASLSVSTAPIA